jgi:type IV secretory pathway VirB4 component
VIGDRLAVHGHLVTTAHACSLYPWAMQTGFGTAGMYIGRDHLAGGAPFCFDAFEAHRLGLVSNPNMFIMGKPGMRKSTLVKTMLWRQQGVYGNRRFVAIADPKNEYQVLGEAMGLSRLSLAPGGATRVNPLAGGPLDGSGEEGRARRQAQMVEALVGTVLGRGLGEAEKTAVWSALAQVRARVDNPILADVVAALWNPTAEMLGALRRDEAAWQRDTEEVALALEGMLARTLRGMFDGDSTNIDWDGPGMVLDLSAVYSDPTALALVMIAVTGWWRELRGMAGRRRWVQVLDELWAVLRFLEVVAYVQESLKLGRNYGVANILVAHRPSDLKAQANDGSAAAKIADGLLSDTATKVTLGQDSGEIAEVAARLGLRGPEAAVVERLVPGRALWQIGGARLAVVQHHLGSEEFALVDTDAAMRAA